MASGIVHHAARYRVSARGSYRQTMFYSPVAFSRRARRVYQDRPSPVNNQIQGARKSLLLAQKASRWRGQGPGDKTSCRRNAGFGTKRAGVLRRSRDQHADKSRRGSALLRECSRRCLSEGVCRRRRRRRRQVKPDDLVSRNKNNSSLSYVASVQEWPIEKFNVSHMPFSFTFLLSFSLIPRCRVSAV